MPTVEAFVGTRFWICFVLGILAVCGLNRVLHEKTPARLIGFMGVQLLLLTLGLQIPPLTLLCAIVGCLVVYALTTSSRMTQVWTALVIGFVLLFRNFFFKRIPWESALWGNALFSSIPFLIIGFAYISLRCISFIIDYRNEKIVSPSVVVFLSYVLFAPSFVAGPIHRYTPFSQTLLSAPKLSRTSLRTAIERILFGLIKKLILVAWLGRWAISLKDGPALQQASTLELWLSLNAYAWMLYFDFSGYTDLAIGTGALFGIPLPENFNWPYFRRNILSFWNSWHASLTQWLREYIFLPLGQRLFRWPWLEGRALTIGVLSYLITMLACGLWHGLAGHYWIWGLYHGLGLSFYKVLKYNFDHRTPKSVQTFWYQSRSAYVLACLLNYHFVIVGWVWFIFDNHTALLVLKRLMGGGLS